MKGGLVFIGMWLLVLPLLAEKQSFGLGYDEFRPYGFQQAEQWKVIRDIYLPGRNFQDSLIQALQQRKRNYLMCPWWLEDLYMNPGIARCCKEGLGYPGYVLNPLTGNPELTNEWRNQNGGGILNDSAWREVPYDLVVYCRGAEAIDLFLRSESARLNFLHQVFDWPAGAVNQQHSGKRPRGIHFYLPDLSFREKRAFVQFIKSVSMVIDSMQLESGTRPYAGDRCMLYVTLGTEARYELNYLSGIAVFVDEIYFTDYNEFGVTEEPWYILNTQNDPTQLITRLGNQFYLFHLSHLAGTGKVDNTDIGYLATADYDNMQWETYFYLEILLILIFVILVILYNFYSPFYMFADRNRRFVTPVIITFVTEVIILFLYILEAISKDDILFSMNDSQHLWLLALPLAFIALNILIRLLNQRKVIP